MADSTKLEVLSIINEMNGIVDELYDISYGIKNDFDGIGNEICAKTIIDIADSYKSVIKQLYTMDLSIKTDGPLKETSPYRNA